MNPYICHPCAYRRKGDWPEGHRGSAHEGKCPYCSQTSMLTSVTDWRWPKDGIVDGQSSQPKED